MVARLIACNNQKIKTIATEAMVITPTDFAQDWYSNCSLFSDENNNIPMMPVVNITASMPKEIALFLFTNRVIELIIIDMEEVECPELVTKSNPKVHRIIPMMTAPKREFPTHLG